MEATIWERFSDYLVIIPSTLLAFLVSYWFYRKQEKKKTLSYEIVTNNKLVEVEGEYKDRLKVFFDDHLVENPHILVLRFKNKGTLPIEKLDFETSLSVHFEDNSKIIISELVDKVPEDIEVIVKSQDFSINLTPGLLNPEDSFSIRLILDTPNPNFRIAGRVRGVKTIKNLKDHIDNVSFLKQSTYEVFYGVFMLSLYLGGFIGILLLIGKLPENLQTPVFITVFILGAIIWNFVQKRKGSNNNEE